MEPNSPQNTGPAAILVNIAAGEIASSLPRIRERLSSAGILGEWIEAEGPSSELSHAATDAYKRGIRNFLIVGGDGTVHHFVNALRDKDYVFAVLPAGGGNDFAAALNVGATLDQAISRLRFLRPRRLDVMRVRTSEGNDCLAIASCGLGIDARAAHLAAARYRRWKGRSRYLASALHAAVRFQGVEVEVEIEVPQRETIRARTLTTSVLNTPTFGAGIRLAPSAKLNDGYLDLALVRYRSLPRLLALIPNLLISGNLPESWVTRFRVKKLRIRTDDPEVVQGDGEVLGTTPVEIEILENYLCVNAGEI